MHNELSGSSAVPLTSENLHYIVKKLARYQPLSLQAFSGLFCSSDFQTVIGKTNTDVTKFLKSYPEIFTFNEKGKVCLLKDSKKFYFSEQKCSINSFASVDISLMQSDIITGEGEVKRLFATYGFLAITYPVSGFVYFTARSFGSEVKLFSEWNLTTGMTLGFEAKKKCAGHTTVEYEATSVWYIEPPEEEYGENRIRTTNRGCVAPVSHHYKDKQERDELNKVDKRQPRKNEEPSCGFIVELHKTHGFIQKEGKKGKRAFFHLRNICNASNCHDLHKLLKVGDSVRFSSVVQSQTVHDKWYAKDVWIGENTSVSGPNSDEEIFVSDSEVSAGEDDSQEKKALGGNADNSSTDALNVKSTNDAPFNSNVAKLCNRQGKIHIKSAVCVAITFGSSYGDVAYVENCPFYVNKTKVSNLRLVLVDDDIVHFDAVRTKEVSNDATWKATLIWIGEKPDMQDIQAKDVSNLMSTLQMNVLEPAEVVKCDSLDDNSMFTQQNKLSKNMNEGSFTHMYDSTKGVYHEDDSSCNLDLGSSTNGKMLNDSSSGNTQRNEIEEQDTDSLVLSVDSNAENSVDSNAEDSVDSNAEDSVDSNAEDDEHSGEECVDEENPLLSQQDCSNSSAPVQNVYEEAICATVAESLKSNKPGVFLHQNLKGKVGKMYRYIAQVSCSELHKAASILLNEFYLDGDLLKNKCTDPRSLLNEGDEISLNAFEIVDDESNYWQKVSLAWMGKKPKHIKQCEPFDFIQNQKLNVNCEIPRWSILKRKTRQNTTLQSAVSREKSVSGIVHGVKSIASSNSSSRRAKRKFLTSVQDDFKDARYISKRNENELQMIPAVPESLMNHFHLLTENISDLRQTACSSDIVQKIENLSANLQSAVDSVLLHLSSSASASKKCALVNKSCQTDKSLN